MERGLRLLALGALLVATAGPCRGAPAPGVTPRCPRSAPPPLPPDCLPDEGTPRGGGGEVARGGDDVMAATRGDVITEGTDLPDVTEDPGAALGRVDEAYGDATTVVGPVPASLGGGDVMAATRGDVITEGTNRPDVTEDPGDTSDRVTEAYGDATTAVGRVTLPQGGEKVAAATRGDVVMEGTEEPCVTDDPAGHGGDTTTAGRATTSQGGDQDVVAHQGGVLLLEGTDQPGVTVRPEDTLGHVTVGYVEDVTVVGPVTTSKGCDKAAVAHDGDVLLEGTDQPGVTDVPGDLLGHFTEVYRDATTMVGPIVTSRASDTLVVATHGDVLLEGTDQPGVTDVPGDLLGHFTEVYRDATTMVGPIVTSQGSDNLMVATHGDVLLEGTDQPGVTDVPGDTLGHVTGVYREATTMVGPVPTSQGGDNLVVATHGDVLLEGTERPDVTNCSGATSGHVSELNREATTMVGPVPTSQGGDNLVVATHGDVLLEGTAQPGATQDPGDTLGHFTEVYRDATTMVGPIVTSRASDTLVVATHGDVLLEGTDHPGVTDVPGDLLGHVTGVYREATTLVEPVPTTQRSDKPMVATHGDVLLEGTEEPSVTDVPGDTLGHFTEVYREATTMVGPVPTSQGGDNLVVATHGDVLLEGTERPDVTNCSGATSGHVSELNREATTMVGPVPTSQGGDNLVVATHGDVLLEGTAQPGATQDPGDTLGHFTEVYRDATTMVGPIVTSRASDTLVVATHGDVLLEGMDQPGVTDVPGDLLGHVTGVYREATTLVEPVPTTQRSDNLVVATHGDVLLEGTEEPSVTDVPGDTLGHFTEVYREATTMVGPVPTSQGGDNLVVATHGDVLLEGTERPDVTNCSGATSGHVSELNREATTMVGPVPTSQGGDNLVVATHGDVLLEGTAQPGATQDPGDTLGHFTEVYRDATTMVGPIVTSRASDTLVVATHGDVLLEGTDHPGVTDVPGDLLGHFTEVYREATTLVEPVPTSQRSDKPMVATHGDVLLEGTEEPSVTDVPGDLLGHFTEVYREATTMVGPVPTSQGGDNLVVATHGDVLLEGTERPDVTNCSGATSGHVSELNREATTMVGPVPTSQGGDNLVVATHGDVLLEGTAQPGATQDPGDTLGHFTEVYRDATTMVGPIVTSRASDTLVVATHGDVLLEGTDQPSVTDVPGDLLGHVTEVYREATTMVGPVPTSQGGDNLVVATHGDVLLEGTERPDVTNCSGATSGHVSELNREATTMVGPVPTSQGGDNLVVATHGDVLLEGTAQPGATQDPGDTLGHFTEVYRDATTMVGPIVTSRASDNLVVATHGDVLLEGTEEPSVTDVPGDLLGHVTEVYREATTMVGPVPTSQGGDNLVVATHGDVLLEGTERPDVTNCSGATSGHVSELNREATTMVGPVPTSQGGDNLVVATHGDVLLEGTAQPGVTEEARDTLGHFTEVYREATTMVEPVPTSQGGDNLVVATHGDVIMEGMDQPGATEDPRATSGHVAEVSRDATTVVGPVAASQGGDDVTAAARADVIMEGTDQPAVTNCSGASSGRVTEDAATAASRGGDDVTPTTRADLTAGPPAPPPRCRPPPPPAAAFPVTAAPLGPHGLSGSSPTPLPLPPSSSSSCPSPSSSTEAPPPPPIYFPPSPSPHACRPPQVGP
ncbi:nascent polypeptide-associated complex subunit alpha, muscle-specific form-like [Grus japonensis]|uniref:Nascent polypeptide-associated complex subunit alpha, muscle-specific form-like n=1 Tax=Grus japonensis TaxID=30415 RepID=A0ABC9XT00_GRUJA